MKLEIKTSETKPDRAKKEIEYINLKQEKIILWEMETENETIIRLLADIKDLLTPKDQETEKTA